PSGPAQPDFDRCRQAGFYPACSQKAPEPSRPAIPGQKRRSVRNDRAGSPSKPACADLSQGDKPDRVSLQTLPRTVAARIPVDCMSEMATQKPRLAEPAPRRPSVAVQIGKVRVG